MWNRLEPQYAHFYTQSDLDVICDLAVGLLVRHQLPDRSR